MAGAYASNAIKEGDQLTSLLKSRGLEIDHYLVGRKALNYYRFRNRAIAASWTGFSDNPTYANAKEIADTVISSFLQENGADELHIIYTEFVSMITQRPLAKRMLPLEVVESSAPLADGPLPLYEFEPSAGDVLDALLPRYVESRIFNALLQSAASEHAARRRAMKSATDNAEELIKSLTRRANAARQAEITQEISEIVGGADALSSATSGGE
ncbi:MAG: ATP synthase F1 subunit gamma [Actinobacteria bacterium]|nr:MAG: ATP synthase F1 subunit gamma [Actinomycetota bacterium]